jgi:hypothetical protein
MGFWNGRDVAEACSEITRVPAAVWIKQHEACENLLNKDFNATMIGAGVIFGCISLWKCMDVLAWRAILRPLTRLKQPM